MKTATGESGSQDLAKCSVIKILQDKGQSNQHNKKHNCQCTNADKVFFYIAVIGIEISPCHGTGAC